MHVSGITHEKRNASESGKVEEEYRAGKNDFETSIYSSFSHFRNLDKKKMKHFSTFFVATQNWLEMRLRTPKANLARDLLCPIDANWSLEISRSVSCPIWTLCEHQIAKI